MSPRWVNLEEGSRNSIPQSIQRCSPSGSEIKRMTELLTNSFYGSAKKFFPTLVQLCYPKGPKGYSFFLVWFMSSVFVDTLFLYIPVINEDKKCFKLDKRTMWFAIVYRSIFDFLYISNFRRNLLNNSHPNIKKKLLTFVFDILIILPLPQALVLLVSNQIVGPKQLVIGMTFFLLLHAIKIIRLYTLFQKAKTEGNLAQWAKVTFNLSFLHAANLYGAIWYFFAVERQTVCWRKACRNDRGSCHSNSFHCNASSEKYTISKDYCSTDTTNTNSYNFGIFYDAIHSGVVREGSVLQRAIPSFRWGLQTVSWLGQGLPFSADLLENLFVMSITVCGVLVFFFLIGKLQMHVQSETGNLEERKQKLKDIERWLPLGNLPEQLQKEVKEYQSQNWRETRGVDVEYVVNNLPEDLRKKIKRKLCLDLLKKVEVFENWSDALLEDLCDVAKPVFYRERSYIVQEGDPIDQMLLVLQGKLWSYTSNTTTESSSTHRPENDVCGVELVAWAQDEASNHLPVSTRTIQALTNVEAFVLMADDFKKGIHAVDH